MISLEDYPTLQSAVDAAGKNELIVIPSGDWDRGAACLKSDLTIRLEKGARLIAPEMPDAYVRVENLRGRSMDRCFLCAAGAENITIEGDGTIELRGQCFWTDFRESVPGEDLLRRGDDGRFPGVFHACVTRPAAVMFSDCRNIRFSGITLRNAPAYTVWVSGCEQVRLERLTILNHRRGPNTDALDIDCSSDVWVTDCRISAGDDCIALKSDIALLGHPHPCERIHLRGNTLSSTCCAVRIGYEGDGVIRDVIVSDTVIHDSNIGFDLISILPGGDYTFGIRHGAKIENIIFSNAVMRNVRQPFKIWSGTEAVRHSDNMPQLKVDPADYSGYVRRIRFSHLEIEATDSSFLGGADVSDVSLDHVHIHVTRDPAVYCGTKPVEMPTVWGGGYLPDPLTVYRVRDLRMTETVAEEEFSAFGVMNFRKLPYVSSADGISDWAMYHHRGADRDCVIVLHGHGSGGDQILLRRNYRPWLEKFRSEGMNVLAPNLRGNAWMCPAAVADLAALIRKGKAQYGWRRIFFVSGSMGGTGALIFALRHPELADGVAALGAATDLQRFARWCSAQTVPPAGSIREAIEAHYGKADYELHNVCSHAGDLTMPVYYAHGGADRIIPVSEARSLRDLLTAAAKNDFRYVEIPEGDHDSPLQLAGEALAYLLEQLNIREKSNIFPIRRSGSGTAEEEMQSVKSGKEACLLHKNF